MTNWYKTAVKELTREIEFTNPSDYYFNIEIYYAPFGSMVDIGFDVKEAIDQGDDNPIEKFSPKEKKMFSQIKSALAQAIGTRVYSTMTNSEFPWACGLMYAKGSNLSEEEQDKVHEVFDASGDDPKRHPLMSPQEKTQTDAWAKQVIAFLKSRGFIYNQNLVIPT